MTIPEIQRKLNALLDVVKDEDAVLIDDRCGVDLFVEVMRGNHTPFALIRDDGHHADA